MEDGPLGLAKFLRDFLYYRMQDNSDESDVPEDYYDDEESMDDEQMRTSEVPMEQLTFPHQEHAACDDDVYSVL